MSTTIKINALVNESLTVNLPGSENEIKKFLKIENITDYSIENKENE
jgi:hypothetical protein